MSELDDLEEIAEQLRHSGNSSRQTRAQRRAYRELMLRCAEGNRSPGKREQRALDRRRPLAESANHE